MQDLENIESSLINLQKDLNNQLSAMSNDSGEFHNILIELISKYPNHKDIIQFTVGINDRIETNQSIFSDIVISTINEMIEVKHEMLRKMIAVKAKEEVEECVLSKTKNKLTSKDFDASP